MGKRYLSSIPCCFRLVFFSYNDPTLVILYESLPTWTGRIQDRQDTCGIIALSINLLDHSHPVIWQVSGLPYDCCACYAVPKPLGGLMVYAANSMIYLDQSGPELQNTLFPCSCVSVCSCVHFFVTLIQSRRTASPSTI